VRKPGTSAAGAASLQRAAAIEGGNVTSGWISLAAPCGHLNTKRKTPAYFAALWARCQLPDKGAGDPTHSAIKVLSHTCAAPSRPGRWVALAGGNNQSTGFDLKACDYFRIKRFAMAALRAPERGVL
jgi:hypothetical protein